MWRIPAVLYLCYTDVMRLDPVTVGAFQPLLRSTSLRALVKVREAGEQAGEWVGVGSHREGSFPVSWRGGNTSEDQAMGSALLVLA